MKSKVAERMLANTTEDIKIFVDKYADLIVRINEILKRKNLTQKDLADKLGKQPSEVHKWLHGEHNLTLRSIAKLEAELGETLLEVPTVHRVSDFKQTGGQVTYKVTVNRERIAYGRSPSVWTMSPKVKTLANVG